VGANRLDQQDLGEPARHDRGIDRTFAAWAEEHAGAFRS
jgi:hypothetical protein